MSALEIRPYHDSDFPAVVAFVSMIQDHEREQGGSNRRLGGKIAVPYAHHICGKVAMDGGMMLIACQNGAPVGFLSAWPERDEDPLIEPETRNHAFVSDVFVLPNWRRTGIAHKMLAQAEQHFRVRGIARIRIGAVPANHTAVNFFQKTGFRPYEVVYERSIPMPTHSIVDGKIVKGAQ